MRNTTLSIMIKGFATNYAGVSKDIWRRVLLTFFNDVTGGVCFYLSLYFVNVLHVNVTVAGIIISCFGVGTIIGGYVGGKLTDLFNPTVVSIVSLTFKASAFLLLMYVQNIELLIITVFILGVSTYGFTTANNVWILEKVRETDIEKLKLINILYTASNFGIGLSAVIISILAHYGFHNIFLLMSIILYFAAMYLILLRNTSYESETVEKNTCFNKNEVNSIEKNKFANMKIVWTVLVCLFFIGLVIAQRRTTYSIYINQLFPNLGVRGISALLALNPFLIVLLQIPVVNLFKKANKLLMTGIGAFLLGIGMLMLSFSFDFSIAVIACIVYTIGEMIFISMAQLVVYQNGAPGRKGQSFGMYKTVYAASIVVGPALGGFIYNHSGAVMIWYLSGVVGVICLIACYLCNLVYKKDQNDAVLCSD